MSITNRVLDWWHALGGKFPETISYGSQGRTVSMWQTVLNIVPPDGSFGPITVEKTKDWQSEHGIDPDGVVGPLTWTAAMKTVGNSATPKVGGAPAGTRPLPQAIANKPAITAFAIETLNNKSIQMGMVTSRNIDGVQVMARIEPHTWTHRGGKLVTGLNPPIRGVTLYQITDPAQFAGDPVVWRVSEMGFDYGSTDGATDRLGGGMGSVGCELYKGGKLKI